VHTNLTDGHVCMHSTEKHNLPKQKKFRMDKVSFGLTNELDEQ